jgi:acyl-coenzyme A thioesterase PaaI-like protein
VAGRWESDRVTDAFLAERLQGVLDVASYVRLLPELAPEENAVTHDATCSLVRGVAVGARGHLCSELVRRGRTLAFLRSEATVDGEVVAMGTVTKSLLRPR